MNSTPDRNNVVLSFEKTNVRNCRCSENVYLMGANLVRVEVRPLYQADIYSYAGTEYVVSPHASVYVQDRFGRRLLGRNFKNLGPVGKYFEQFNQINEEK